MLFLGLFCFLPKNAFFLGKSFSSYVIMYKIVNWVSRTVSEIVGTNNK